MSDKILKFPTLNNNIISGYLTADPELRYVGENIAICKFSIAHTRKWNSKDGKQEKTEFWNVECWGAIAEYIGDNCGKGMPVIVEGELQSDEWEAKDGTKRTKAKIKARKVETLCWNKMDKTQGNNYGGYEQQPKPRKIEEPMLSDDLPF